MPIPENVAGALVYVTFIPAILFLLIEPYKRSFFVRFHCFQLLFLCVAVAAMGIGFWIVADVMLLIPFIRILVFPLGMLLALAAIALWGLLVVKAYQGIVFKLPIIGDRAERQTEAWAQTR
jgi:uncharacterized membrane protein